MSGGKGGSQGSGLKDYYASFAGIAGWGPAYSLVALHVDKKEVWKPGSPVLASASSNPYQFDVSGYGRVYFYWGTDTQTLTDPVLTASGREHPPYRRRVLVVFEDFLCGRERESVPDMQVIYRRKPQQTLITGSAAELDSQGQANPLAALVERITDPVRGLGKSNSFFNATAWQDLADSLYTNRSKEYLTIDLSSTGSVRSLIEEINGYLDTYFRADDDGLLEVGQFLNGLTYPTGLTTLTEHDLAKGKALTIDPQPRTLNSSMLQLNFINRDKKYEDDSARFEAPVLPDQIGGEKVDEIERQAIRRGYQANAKVAEFGAKESRPWDSVIGSYREEKVQDLSPGDLVNISHGPTSYLKVNRILRMNGDSDKGGPRKLTMETERMLAPSPGDFDEDLLPSESAYPLEDINYWHILQAPPILADLQPYKLIALIGQDHGSWRGGAVYFQDAASEYVYLGSQSGFAVPVLLADNYADTEDLDDTSGNLVIELTDPAALGFANLETAPTEDQISDDDLLLIVIDPDDFTQFEIMTVQSIESPTAGEYPIHVLRARFGTSRLSFSTGDPAYFIRRKNLNFFEHRRIPKMALETAEIDRTASLKITPFKADEELDLSSATAKSLEIFQDTRGIQYDDDGNPVITDPNIVTTVPVPSVSPPAQTFASTLDVDASVSAGTIYYTTNGQKPDLGSSQWSSTVTISETTQFRFRTYLNGKWSDEVNITYSKETAPSSQQVATPTFNPPSMNGYGGTLYISCATPSSTIYYKLIDYPPSDVPTMDADGANTGGWSTYSSPVTVPAGNKFVWAYGYKSGLVNSGPTGFSSYAP